MLNAPAFFLPKQPIGETGSDNPQGGHKAGGQQIQNICFELELFQLFLMWVEILSTFLLREKPIQFVEI